STDSLWKEWAYFVDQGVHYIPSHFLIHGANCRRAVGKLRRLASLQRLVNRKHLLVLGHLACSMGYLD
ncbi:unnamed protein product, partial [Wuchereria bancrofti]